MRRIFLLLVLGLLTAAIASAQDVPSGTGAQEPGQTNHQSSSASKTVIRGCLRGSAGNYTLTDKNGAQYKLVGSDDALQAKVGHEVEINGTEIQSGDANGEQPESTSRPSNGIQVSTVRDVSATCNLGQNGAEPLSENGIPQGSVEPVAETVQR